jgi:glycosyltransferase involved in cell wall biosynthesis
MFRQATLILCKTRETLAVLPSVCQRKSRIHLEIGLEPARIKQEFTARMAGADFLYAGRLVYWKGLHLALKAFVELRRYRPNATLTVIGTGKDEAKLKSLSVTLGLQDSVRWLGRIPHEEIWAHYGRYTAFVFPSLHDSSGNVLLEALSQALPVICLDTGGPGAVLSSSCGIKVRVENRSEAEVVGDLTAAMQELADNPELCIQMGRRALEVARAST